MALTTVLVIATVLVALTDGLAHPNFGYGGIPEIRMGFAPALPLLQPLGFGGFRPLRLPQPPPLPVISFDYDQPTYKPYEPDSSYPHPSFPTFDTVRNVVPLKGGSYNGVMVSSSSNSNGQGVASILVNNNGEIFHKTIVNPGNTKKDPNCD